MMQMEYFNGVTRDPVKEPVRIAAERDDANTRTMRRTTSAFRPFANLRNDHADPPFQRRRSGREVDECVCADCLKIGKGFGCPNDLHTLRNLASTASTCSSVAKRFCSASRKPRSMPASSSAVGS